MLRTALALTHALMGLPAASSAWASPWPELPAPPEAQVAVVAADSVLDGKHSRVLRLALKGGMDDALAFYRHSLGAQRVENKQRGGQLLASRQGNFFTTVQLRARPGSDGIEATVIHTALDEGRSSSRALQDTRSWLPTDSTVLRSMESTDAEQRSLLLAAANQASLQANREHLLLAAQKRGMRLTKEAQGNRDGRPTLALWLQGGGEAVTLTLVDAGRYRSLLIHRVKGDTP